MTSRRAVIPAILACLAFFALGVFYFLSAQNQQIVRYSPTQPVLPAAVTTSAIPEKKVTSLKIMIGGDIMLDRRIRMLGDKNGYDSFFTELKPLFQSANIAIANLEGPITAHPSKTLLPDGSYSKELTFTFSPNATQALKNAGLYAVNLANNHTSNFGRDGFEETQAYLQEWKVGYFGSPWNASSTELTVDENDIKVAFVGYHEFAPDLKNILSDIRRLNESGYFVIVVPHWGDEYDTHPNEIQYKVEKLMIEAGARAIVGSHPHVRQNYEWVGGVPVFFSVGNLLFDQYWSKEVSTGAIVELDLTKSGGETKLTAVKTYTISLANRTSVAVDPNPTEIPLPSDQ